MSSETRRFDILFGGTIPSYWHKSKLLTFFRHETIFIIPTSFTNTNIELSIQLQRKKSLLLGEKLFGLWNGTQT